MLFNSAKKELLALQLIIDRQASLLKAIDRSMATIEFDTHGVVLSANDNFLSVTGYTDAELAGRHHSMFCERELIDSQAASPSVEAALTTFRFPASLKTYTLPSPATGEP